MGVNKCWMCLSMINAICFVLNIVAGKDLLAIIINLIAAILCFLSAIDN